MGNGTIHIGFGTEKESSEYLSRKVRITDFANNVFEIGFVESEGYESDIIPHSFKLFETPNNITAEEVKCEIRIAFPKEDVSKGVFQVNKLMNKLFHQLKFYRLIYFDLSK